MIKKTPYRPAVSVIARGTLMLMVCGLTGCATIINGTTQDVSFATRPEGATVRAGEGSVCQTPCTLTLKRKQDHMAVISREGYEDASVTIQHVVSGAVAGNIIAGGLIGWGIDAASGGQYRLVPEAVSIDLRPLRSAEGSALQSAVHNEGSQTP